VVDNVPTWQCGINLGLFFSLQLPRAGRIDGAILRTAASPFRFRMRLLKATDGTDSTLTLGTSCTEVLKERTAREIDFKSITILDYIVSSASALKFTW
jgi:hypothetical protein